MKKNYDIFIGQQDLIDIGIEFYTSPAINPEKFEEIKTICLDWDNKMRQARGQGRMSMGHFSVFDFIGPLPSLLAQFGSMVSNQLSNGEHTPQQTALFF